MRIWTLGAKVPDLDFSPNARFPIYGGLLQPRERRQWEHFSPLLAHFRARVDEAMSAGRAGRRLAQLR